MVAGARAVFIRFMLPSHGQDEPPLGLNSPLCAAIRDPARVAGRERDVTTNTRRGGRARSRGGSRRRAETGGVTHARWVRTLVTCGGH